MNIFILHGAAWRHFHYALGHLWGGALISVPAEITPTNLRRQCLRIGATISVVNASLEPGSAAKAAEDRKKERYSTIAQRHIFIPVAVETTGVLGPAAAAFLSELGRRITDATGDRREVSWLRQRVSLAVIRGNAAAVLSTTRPAQGPQNNILSQQNRPHAHLGKKSRPQGSTPAFTAARSGCRVAVPAGKVATIQRRRGLLNLCR